jgi:hypothetical protein
MDRKEQIKSLVAFLNYNWWNHIESLDMFFYNLWDIEKAYLAVYKEMCALLDADVIVREYKDLLQQSSQAMVLRHCHYYVNSCWNILNKTSFDKNLLPLQLKLSTLLLYIYVFLDAILHLDRGHGHRRVPLVHLAGLHQD